MTRPMLIEKVKNACIVVLLLSTVLLLYFFWGNITFDDLRSSVVSAELEVPDTNKLVKPEQIVVNFGTGDYTVAAPGDIWSNDTPEEDSFSEILSGIGPVENIRVTEITEEQYQQVRSMESIWVEFSYNIPITDFCNIFEIRKPQSLDAIETVNQIGYSPIQGENSLFLCDGRNKIHYLLEAGETEKETETTLQASEQPPAEGFPALIASVEAQGYDTYYPAASVLGVENNTLVPVSVRTDLRKIPYTQGIYTYQTEKINTIAEQFFGSNFDFVRTITEENGTVIYMYGYGQNVLIVNPDGSIEYKEEQIDDNKGQGFTEALETAVNFVATHGSWESFTGIGLTPYLKDVIVNPGKKTGFRFIFGVELNGNRVYYEGGDPIIVDITSGQATYYKRHLVEIYPGDMETIETGSASDAFSVANLIAENYRYLYDILLPAGDVKATADPAEMFEIIAGKVKDMKIGYVKPANTGATEITPAWIVSIDKIVVYFDLYTAEPIGFSKE